MEWSLKELYASFDDELFEGDLTKLKELAKSFNEFASNQLQSSEDAQSKCEQYVSYQAQLSHLLLKLMSFANLTSAVDASNERALYYMNYIQELANEFVKPSVAFKMFIKAVNNLDEVIEASDTLKEFEYHLHFLKDEADYLLSEAEEILISKMRLSGSTAWSNLQNKVTSTLMIDVELDGQTQSLPLPAVRNLAYHHDAAVRKMAYEAELAAYSRIEEASGAALNGIKGEVITINGLRGYDSPLVETLRVSRMDQDTLDAMLKAMKKALPSFQRYYQHKAKLLNHKEGLPFYDLFAPIKKSESTYTYDEAMTYIIKQFESFSLELAAYTQKAYDAKWIDYTPRNNKRGGAFCMNIHSIKESRIMSNFDGSFSNLITLAHELGHGYHGQQLVDESIINSRYPMPLAETASIFCETIVVNAALKEVSDEEQIAILEASISDAGQVIVDILSRFFFESALFEKRAQGVVSVGELKNMMLESQKRAYGDGLDHNYLHPYMWLNKPHYYSAGLNFYNFPYAFGLLFAKGLYAQYLEQSEGFLEKYNNLLKATGKNNIKDVASMVNVDVGQSEFFEKSLALIEKDIERFIELTS